MNCPDARPLLHAYFDRELDLVRSLEVESHLTDCSGCDRAYQSLEVLRRNIRSGGLYHHAPPALAANIRSRSTRTGASTTKARHFAWRWDWTFAAAAMLALAVTGVSWLVMSNRRSAGGLLAQEVVSAHVRSLMADHATDVTSTDQHTVKPWFAGKLDFSPPVIDLAPEGFPLTGGRLDYLSGRAVAALVYGRRKHVINLFVWPARESPDSVRAGPPMNGFNVVHWAQAGMDWWAVSDLNAIELGQFAELIRARVVASK